MVVLAPVRTVRATGTNWLTLLTPELTPLRGARSARAWQGVTAAVTAKQGVSNTLRSATSSRCGATHGYGGHGYGQGYGPGHEGAGQRVASFRGYPVIRTAPGVDQGIAMTATQWRRLLSLATADGFHSEVSTLVATETTHILGRYRRYR